MKQDPLMNNPRLLEFADMVRDRLTALQPHADRRREALAAERNRLERQRSGWLRSLADPDLPDTTRAALNGELGIVIDRINEISVELSRLADDDDRRINAVDMHDVVQRINDLQEVLESGNCSAGNILLAHHIDGIYCDASGQVTIRTCKLGVLGGDLDVPTAHEPLGHAGFSNKPTPNFKQRRLTYRNLDDIVEDDAEGDALNDFALDVHRFDDLEEWWFTEDLLHVPVRISHAESIAKAAAEYRLEHGVSIDETAVQFKVSTPTMRKALIIAKDKFGIEATGCGIAKSERPNFIREKALEVAEFLRRPGATVKSAIEHFGKCEKMIWLARKEAAKILNCGDEDDATRDRRRHPRTRATANSDQVSAEPNDLKC